MFVERRVARERFWAGGKGGFRRPCFGMRNFWCEGGMEREVVMWVERSDRVAVEGKVRWWV